MQLTQEMQEKLAFIAAGGHLRFSQRDDPKPKPKTLYLAQFKVRSEAVSGGAVPDDEVQLEFVISTDKRDGHYSYMNEKTLRNYGEGAAAGVPFVRDHTESMETQIGRTIAGVYDAEKKRTTATISMLRDTDDTPENMRVNEYIRRIERGYYNSCSVGFRDGEEICRLDNKPIWDWNREDPCPHMPGRTYPEGICEYDVNDAHLRHVALVSSPSNPEAKLLDRSQWEDGLRTLKEEGLKQITDASDPKSILERDGLKYRTTLIEKALKEGVRAEDDFDEDKWKKRFDTMESDTIVDQTNTWEKLGDARWGEGGRKTDSGIPTGSPDEKPLILPSYLFEV